MAVQQQTIAHPVLVIAAILCAVLFAYVIFTQRHESTDKVVNPNVPSVDTQILGNTKIALPLRQKVPPKFGSPSNTLNAVPINTGPAFYTPAPTPVPPSTGTLNAKNKSSSAPMSTTAAVPVPLSAPPAHVVSAHPPAYTVLVKTPGDRMRKTVIVNH
jgi:hypothetical protein